MVVYFESDEATVHHGDCLDVLATLPGEADRAVAVRRLGPGRCSMTALVEIRSGAQVLPPAEDERVTTSSWFARLACDADLRARVTAYAQLASTLKVVAP